MWLLFGIMIIFLMCAKSLYRLLYVMPHYKKQHAAYATFLEPHVKSSSFESFQ